MSRPESSPPNASWRKAEEYRGDLQCPYMVRTIGISVIDTMTLSAGGGTSAIGG